METTDVSIDDSTNSDENLATTSSVISTSDSFPFIRFLNAPVTTVLEYAGVIRPRLINNEYHESESDSLIHDHDGGRNLNDSGTAEADSSNGENGEVSIRIRVMWMVGVEVGVMVIRRISRGMICSRFRDGLNRFFLFRCC